MNSFIRWLGRTFWQAGCKRCGWRNSASIVWYHSCREVDRIAYWRMCQAYKGTNADPTCLMCGGSGTLWNDESHKWFTVCRCAIDNAAKLTPPTREEDAVYCRGLPLLCQQCWDEMTLGERREFYLSFMKQTGQYPISQMEEIMRAVERESKCLK